MNRKLALNTLIPLIEKVVAAICGFIIPGLVLKKYGSEVSGLVNSIAQFLSAISLLEFGMGAVVRSSLYKPLVEKDSKGISKIVSAANAFFTKLGNILLVYVIVLIFIYPYMSKNDFKWGYTATLIIAISIGQFSQYYFGAVDTLLLMAGQKSYIISIVQISTTIISTIASVIILNSGGSIHFLKIATAIIYLIKPVVYRRVVNKEYTVNRKMKYSGEPIQQKWNGVAQHITNYVFNNTDNIILTLFSTLSYVSVYSIYNLVALQLRQLFYALSSGFQDLLGELWAKKDMKMLNVYFSKFEWGIHNATILIFGCTASLIVPFVQAYTHGVTDVNYIQPLFGTLLVLCYIAECLCLPYITMILVAGHYKQTQRKYIITAIINIVISIITVHKWNIVGVVMGTLIAMIYRCSWMLLYVSKNLNKYPIKISLKQFCVDFFMLIVGLSISGMIKMHSISFGGWFFLAIKTFVIWGTIITGFNLLCYKGNLLSLLSMLQKRFTREKDIG